MIHELKTWKEYFIEVLKGNKDFEIRKNDRNYQVGDTLILIEGDLGGDGTTESDLTWFPTGRTLSKTVTYILHGGKFGIEPGYVVMSIK